MTRARVVASVVVITAIKLILAAHWGWTNNIPEAQMHAEAFLAGRHHLSPWNVNPTYATIFPLGYYVLSCGVVLAAQATGWPFAFWLKVPAILADVVIAWALSTARQGGRSMAWWYLCNPVTFLLSVYHGQLHTVATMGAVLAVRAAERRRSGLSGLALGLAASVRQHFGLLILPLGLAVRPRWRSLLLSFALVAVLANLTLLGTYRKGIMASPVWAYGAWGYGMLLLQGPRLLALVGCSGMASVTEGVNHALQLHGSKLYWVWAALFWGWIWRRHRRRQAPDLWRSALVFLLGLYAISPGFGVQWLVWALPFWLLVNRREAVRYSILAGLFLAGSYWQWSLNAKYGVESMTANLSLLQRADLIGVLLVGVCGLLTWLFCVRATWRLAWAR